MTARFFVSLTSVSFVLALFLATVPKAKADDVRYIAHDEQFIASVVSLIQSAKKSIDMAYFIYEPCHPSTQFIHQLLIKKARQGVRVRFLLDAFMYKKKMRQAMAVDFANAGIEFKVFNPRLMINPAVNFRMHVKLLLVDGKSYISGGRNIADEYFGLSLVYNFVDSDVWVSGASAKQAAQSFAELWQDRHSRSVNLSRKESPSLENLCRESEYPNTPRWTSQVHQFMAERAQVVTQKMRRHSCRKTQFITDNPLFRRFANTANYKDEKNQAGRLGGEELKQKRTTFEFLKFIRETEERLELENWSYMPLELIDDELELLRQREIPILVMTNLDADNAGAIKNAEDFLNHKFAQRDSEGSQVVIQLASKGHLSDRHALTPRGSFFRLHQKTGIRDDRDLLVGSLNIDPRSYHTNLESLVVLEDCASLAQEYTQHASSLVRSYNKDHEDGYNKAPRPPGLGTVLFSFFGFHFL